MINDGHGDIKMMYDEYTDKGYVVVVTCNNLEYHLAIIKKGTKMTYLVCGNGCPKEIVVPKFVLLDNDSIT